MTLISHGAGYPARESTTLQQVLYSMKSFPTSAWSFDSVPTQIKTAPMAPFLFKHQYQHTGDRRLPA
jgi:hypothetical protein